MRVDGSRSLLVRPKGKGGLSSDNDSRAKVMCLKEVGVRAMDIRLITYFFGSIMFTSTSFVFPGPING